MICHTVLWALHDPARAGDFRAELLRCRALVPGLRRFDVGVRAPGLPASVDVALVAWFDDAAALATYQDHPTHQAVSARLAPWRRERHVLDFDMHADMQPNPGAQT